MASKHFGKRVLQARLDMAARLGRPVTQREIAAALGVNSVTVGRWEGGIKEPDLATIERLAAVLGVRPHWLAFGDDEDSAPVPEPESADRPPESYGRRMPLMRGRAPEEERAPKKRGA